MTSILLVEDDDLVARVLTRAVANAGHDVVHVANGEQAIETLAIRSFDVVITDLKMPRVDGLAVIRAVRALGAATAVIAMSGCFQPSDEQLLNALNVTILPKPFGTREFSAALAAALQAR